MDPLKCSEEELARCQECHGPGRSIQGSLSTGGVGRLQRADRQGPLYLQGLLQSGDVFAADFHVIQRHLGDRTEECYFLLTVAGTHS